MNALPSRAVLGLAAWLAATPLLASHPHRVDVFALSDGIGAARHDVSRDWCVGGRTIPGDLDADGKTDLQCVTFRGASFRGLSTGRSLITSASGREGFCYSGRIAQGDFDGDGRMDLHCELPAGEHWWSLTDDPQRYNDGLMVANGWCVGGHIGYGDFDGDGRTDLHCRIGGDHWWGLSNGRAGFLTSARAAAGWCAGGQIGYGDFDGDGRTDLHCRIGADHWWGLSNGTSGFMTSVRVGTNWCAGGEIGYGDFDGDGRQDLHCRIGSDHWWGESRGAAGPLRSVKVATRWCAGGEIGYGDFDGDGRTDLDCRLGGDHWWGISSGADGFLVSRLAAPGLPEGTADFGDFDGDGRQDLHIARTTWEDDLDGDGVDDAAVEVVPCGAGSRGRCLRVTSNVPGAGREVPLEPQAVTVHSAGAIGRHFGGALPGVYVYYSLASGTPPVLAVFDLATGQRVASASPPAGFTLANTYFGVLDGPGGLKRPFLAPGAHYLGDPNLQWSSVCVFDPGSPASTTCGEGFRVDPTGDLTSQAGFRHSGGWLEDADGDGWDDIHLPYLGGYIQTLSGATGRQIALTRIEVSPGADPPVHGGRNYATFTTFTSADGRKQVLIAGGNPAGSFPDVNCNVSRFMAVLDEATTPDQWALRWTRYYSFMKSNFRSTVPPDPACAPNQCCPVAPESLELVSTGDMVNLCLHRVSDSVMYAGSEPVTVYNVFASDPPADDCMAEQRVEWANCFSYAERQAYNRCALTNFLPATGSWTTQMVRLSDGSFGAHWRNAYAWGRVRDMVPGEPDLLVVESLSADKVRFDMEGYVPTALWVLKIVQGSKWQVVGRLPVAGRPDIVVREPVEGGTGATWTGIADIVQRDVDGDGRSDFRLHDGTWVGYSVQSNSFVVKPAAP